MLACKQLAHIANEQVSHLAHFLSSIKHVNCDLLLSIKLYFRLARHSLAQNKVLECLCEDG